MRKNEQSILKYHGLFLQKQLKDKNVEFLAGSPMKLNEDGTISICDKDDFFATVVSENPQRIDIFKDMGVEYKNSHTLSVGRTVWYLSKNFFRGKINVGDQISVLDGKYIRAENNYFIGKIISPAEKLPDGLGNFSEEMFEVLFYEAPIDLRKE